jgi:hypothetical protein
VTFKDLQRLIGSQSEINLSSNNPKQNLLSRLKDKSFWLWDSIAHKEKYRIRGGNCCFNHIIGLPKKDGIEKSIFDYEKLLYDCLLLPEFYNLSKYNPSNVMNSKSCT